MFVVIALTVIDYILFSFYNDKKKTIFINPGSVGQPRNINPCAQFGILDTQTTEYTHVSVPYDFRSEQELYTDDVDVFYKDRLTLGI